MLKQYEQDQIRMGIVAADLDSSSRLITSGSTWVSCEVFTKQLRETISDEMVRYKGAHLENMLILVNLYIYG